MIEIKCADNERTSAVCPAATASTRVFEMVDRTKVIGTAIAELAGTTVHLLRCDAPDGPLTDALFRAVLNAMMAEGATEALSDAPHLIRHAAQKGYVPDFAHEPLQIKEFFSKFVCKG